MVARERVLKRQRGATNAPLRVDDCRFAPGFESANLRKNRRPPARAGPRPALRLLVFLSPLLRMTYGITPQPEGEPTQVEIRPRGDVHVSTRAFDYQVVLSWTGTDEVTSGCADARSEIRIVPADSSITTRRPPRSYFLEPRLARHVNRSLLRVADTTK